MTTSQTQITLLSRLRRTLTRYLSWIAFSSATLTLSVPPFFKLEIKTESAKPKARRAKRYRVA